MSTPPSTTIHQHFAAVPDPRLDRTKQHHLLDILTIARCAVICGADGWVEIRKGQAYLHGIQINEYAPSNRWGHEVARVRKLLGL